MSTATQVHIPVEDAELEGMLEIPDHAIGLVLFAHGSGSSRHSPRNNAVAGVLREAGVGTLLMDLLGADEELVYARRFDIALRTRRLEQAAQWAAEQPLTAGLPLGFFGASTGAAAALEAAARLGDSVRAIVSRGGRPDLAREQALRTVTAPTLLLVGGSDRDVMKLNQLAYDRMHCKKDFIIIPGATHLFEEPGAMEKVSKRAANWFSRHLVQQAAAA